MLLLGGCATTGPRFDAAASLDRAAEDPWEPVNRRIHAFNDTLDRWFVRPVADVYNRFAPVAIRRAVRNFYGNLAEPSNLVNALAQGKFRSAGRAVERLAVNMTAGALGVADEATRLGLDAQPHDLGQTFAVWGVRSGPFVMLPFLGPSTVRDGVGQFLELFLDPVRYGRGVALNPTQSLIENAVEILSDRAALIEQGEQIRRGSADDYATVRSAWLQLRRAELYDGDPPVLEDDLEGYEDFKDEPSSPTPPEPGDDPP